MDRDVHVQAALDFGADRAALIAPSQLVCSDRFRAYCEDNVCGFYGKCWSCPPDIGDINVLIAQLRTFDHIVMYQVISLVKDYSDTEGMNAAGEKLSEISQKLQIFLRTFLKKPFLHLGGVVSSLPGVRKNNQ